MDIEEIRQHKAKAEQEIAAALAPILYRLVEVTGQAPQSITVTGVTHYQGRRPDAFVVSNVVVDLGAI